MEPWRIELLGKLRAERAGVIETRFRTRKTAALLARLAFYPRRSHPRDELIEMLWPESNVDDGRNSLSQALRALRAQLEPSGTQGHFIVATRTDVQLVAEAFITDVGGLDQALSTARGKRGPDRIAPLEAGVTLYGGELLPGFEQEWILAERERLKQAFVGAAHGLVVELEALGEHQRALDVARRAVVADPLVEETHRDLIRLHAATGELQAASLRYRELERILHDQLGSSPSAATRELMRELERRPATRPAPRENIAPPTDQPAPPSGTALLLAIDGSDDTNRQPLVASLKRVGAQSFISGAVVWAVFGRPSQAIATISGLREHWTTLRIAVDFGEVEAAAQGAVFQRAAGLVKAAHAGQMLASEVAAALLRPAGTPRFVDLGMFRLEGLASAERLFELRWPDSETIRFPPPHAALARVGNLPLQLTRFVGRESELAALKASFEAGDRLVTITGSAGMGKTRLSQEGARRALPAFPGGVWFVPLAEVTDAERLPLAIRDALRLPVEAGLEPLTAVASALAGDRALFVLDNLEQLKGASAAVAALIDALPSAVCLTTSRTRLQLGSERLLVLPPLTTPRELIDPSRLAEVPSVQLFVDRARASVPDFRLSAHNAAAVAELCNRLEGLPLALELAAARINVFPPAEILSRLREGVDWLASRRRDLPARHRTLRAAIEWSHGLLDPGLRALLGELSVFHGGFTIRSAVEVCGEPAVEGVEALYEASLLVRSESSTQVRFSMLEAVRAFALEQLTKTRRLALERSHAEHFTAWVALNPQRFRTADELVEEEDNLRAAMTWAVEALPSLALRLGVSLERLWLARDPAEGFRLMERALDKAPKSPIRARALCTAARLGSFAEHHEASLRLAEEALASARRGGDAYAEAYALAELSRGARRAHDLARGLTFAERGIAAARAAGEHMFEAHCLLVLGWVRATELQRKLFQMGGDLNRFPDRGEVGKCEYAALALFRGLDDCDHIAYALLLTGAVKADFCEFAVADQLLEEALASAEPRRHVLLAMYAKNYLGGVRRYLGRLDSARELLEAGLLEAGRLGHRRAEARAGAALASTLRAQGETALASQRGLAALRAARDCGEPVLMLEALDVWADIALATGDLGIAVEVLGGTAAARDALGDAPPPRTVPLIAFVTNETRQVLGDIRFNTAYAAGQARSLPETIALALGEKAATRRRSDARRA